MRHLGCILRRRLVLAGVMTADGASDSLLAEIGKFEFPRASVRWSPDGKKLVYVSNQDGNFEIYLMNADGTEQKRLTQNPAEEVSPSFSPNGKKILFVSGRDGNLEIYTMDLNGGNVTRLTNTPDVEAWPAFSPDGKKIAYHIFRINLGTFELWVMNADGTGQTKVMDASQMRRVGLCWSPDGKRLAYVTDKDGNREVYTAKADGSDERNVTQHPARDTEPSWWAPK